MKTRNCRKPTIVKSHASKSGVGNYNRTLIFGVAANKQEQQQRSLEREGQREAKKLLRQAERLRQRSEKDLPWDFIRLILNSDPTITLEQAKRTALQFESL